MATDPTRVYPSELPALALRETVVFPLTLQPLAISRPISIESVNRALASDAEGHLQAAFDTMRAIPMQVGMSRRAADELAQLRAWRTAHP